MAITSVGYDGTVDEKQFRDIMGFSASSEYGVAEPGGFAASSVAGQVLQVRIAAGTAWTAGVVDKMDAAETVQLEGVVSGSRWDMIVLRRDYQPPGGTTTLQVVKGSPSYTLPARQENKGVLDDQPLWFVKVESQGGQSVISQYVDLRVWARNGGCTANHDKVREYLNGMGTMVEINGTWWLRRNGANNQSEWVKPVELALAGDITVGRIRLTASTDATPTSKGHAFQVGEDSGPNVVIDTNEIMARNNGKPEVLYIEGGASSGKDPAGPADLTRKDYVDAQIQKNVPQIASGRTIVGLVSPWKEGGAEGYRGVIAVPFPKGRFTSAPTVTVTADSTVPGRVQEVSVSDITPLGCRIYLSRANDTATGVYWIAVNE